MTTKQVMSEIKLMTAEERQQVAELLRQLEVNQASGTVDDCKFEEIADRIFDCHAPLMRKLAS